MPQRLVATILLVLGCTQERAQPQNATRPAFEVASIKPKSGGPILSKPIRSGDNINMSCTIGLFIQYAYRVLPVQIVAKPGLLQEFYDLQAKTGDPGASDDRIRLMVQSLLEDRFELKFHREQKLMPAFSIQAGKNGPRLKNANSDDPPLNVIGRQVPDHFVGNYGGLAQPRLIGHKASIPVLAEYLSRELQSIVFDDTGLKGEFEFELSYTAHQNASDPPLGPDLFEAVQQQLGLKLQAVKRPVETLVIDHVSRPSAN